MRVYLEAATCGQDVIFAQATGQLAGTAQEEKAAAGMGAAAAALVAGAAADRRVYGNAVPRL